MEGRIKKQGFTLLAVTVMAALLVGGLMLKGPDEAGAAGGVVKDATEPAPDRYTYYPGTESLGEDEIRIIALGTGMPAARRGQAATCWLVELGNGDKFIFDIGTGANANMAALMIPYDDLSKVFLTHLHTDHWGDLPGLWAGGWTSGRTGALEIWGPSGATPEMGTKYAVEHFLKAYNWDRMTRLANLASGPGEIKVNEFDYKGENAAIYQNNGVTIKSWPAIHAGDGSVSMALFWKGMKIVIGGDTMPNKWYIEHAKDADFAIHEAFMTPELLVKFYNQDPRTALGVGTYVHTSPQAFGKVMSAIKPRIAVAYHFFNEEGTRFAMYEKIRETYDGPLSMAQDMMVWNITKDKITERMATSTEDAWGVPGDKAPPPPDRTVPDQLTKWSLDHRWNVDDVQQEMIKEFKKKYNMK